MGSSTNGLIENGKWQGVRMFSPGDVPELDAAFASPDEAAHEAAHAADLDIAAHAEV